MSQSKNDRFYAPQRESSQDGAAPTESSRRSSDPPSEQQGWDAYRKWLSRVSMQPNRRTARDVSIYSWRGYNSWADKVRQNWESEDS